MKLQISNDEALNIPQVVRLVTNTVVAYNDIILNMLYMKLIELGCSEKDIERFLRISPMLWIHISFTWRYTFNNKNNKIDLYKIIITLEKELKGISIKNL